MNQTIFIMCYFSAERFCIGHCSVFLDNSKRLKVNSGILDGYTGILNLESQIDFMKGDDIQLSVYLTHRTCHTI